MRTLSKLGFAILGVALSAVGFVSCSEDDQFDDKNEIVIESKVLEQGAEPEVTVDESGTDGISLNYDTWIRVYRRTNQASTEAGGETVTVTLNNVIENEAAAQMPATAKSRAIDNLSGSEEYSCRISYEAQNEPRQIRKYVTVQDSVLLFTRVIGETEITHRFVYQVAVYDDGKTKQVMPYYRYENVKDCGLKTEVENETSAEGAYKVTRYISTVSADFNGNTYTSVKTAEIKEAVVDYLVSSTVIDEGNDLLEQDNKIDYKGKSVSWIEVEQVWSESGTKKFKVETVLTNSMVPSYKLYSQEVPEKYYSGVQIKREGTFSDPVADHQRTEGNVTITGYKQTYLLKCSAAYGSEKFFDVSGDFFYEVPVYKDELLQYEMPHYTYSSPSPSFSFASNNWVEEDGVWKCDVRLGFSSNFGYEAVSEDILWIYKYQTQFIYKP